MGATQADAAEIGRINLPKEKPLTLGSLSVDPARRRIVHLDGREEIVEPRVMQVLVALVRAEGQILSRDDLLMSCWHGVVVGEDSIDRVIGRLRRLADGIGGGEFKIETITKVGYRLAPSDARAAPVACGANRLSVCVLPFANMSVDPEQEYFSDGITEDIITDLSKVSSLFVAARTNSFAFKGKDLDIPQVARQLNVGYVLEGSVRKAEGRVRITAQLIDAATGGHVWAERYDRDLRDIFALQDEISRAIVAALKLSILPEERQAMERRETSEPEAYNLYLLARRYNVSGCEGDLRSLEAIERLCRRATEIDPNYARAWDLLGVARTMRSFNHGQPGDNGLSAVERALSLDPGLAEAHAVLARHLFERGRVDDAFTAVRTALSLDPLSWPANSEAGRLHYVRHEFREAISYWEASLALPETSRSDPGRLMSCYHAIGDIEGARRAARVALARAEEVMAHDHVVSGASIGCAASALAVLGEHEQARDLIDRALLIDPDNLRMRYNFACGAVIYLKDTELALELLRPVFEGLNSSWLKYAGCDPDLEALRDDPRFMAMVKAAELRTAADNVANLAIA